MSQPRRVSPLASTAAALALFAGASYVTFNVASPPPPPQALLSAPAPAARQVAFRTHDGRHYVTAEPDGRVVADRTEAHAWEEWTPQLHGAQLALVSAHGRYLSAQPDGTLEANRSAAFDWELFTVVPGDGGIGLRSHHGTFVVAEGGGGGAVRVDRAYTRPGPWETFAPSAPLPGATPAPGAGAQGALRLTPAGYADDRGAVLPVYAHAGNLFSLYTRDGARALAELDAVAAAGYRGVRAWASLSGAYWAGDHVGPDVTPAYWTHVEAFRDALRARGLRAVWSLGDVGAIRDRRAYMERLALVERDAPFADFIDCGNEAWQTGEPDPARLARCVGYYQTAGGQAIRSLTSPPGETKDLLDQYSIPPAQVWDVHSWRDGRWYDKRRHLFSITYEGRPRLRYGINSEPPGNGALVSASQNKEELDDEAVALLGVAGVLARQAWVWFSGEGVKIRAGLQTEAGFAATPRAIALLPADVMSWPDVFHSGSGPEISRRLRVLEAEGDVRIDCAARGADRACTIDGPSGAYDLRWARAFAGRLCHPATAACEDVVGQPGGRLHVEFRRGRILIGAVR